MCKKMELVNKELPLRLDLQFFAGEGDGAGGGDGGGDGTGGNTMTFDDFLKQGDNQAEFDRRVQKATNTAVTNAQEKWRVMTDDKVSEAEKLAKMNEQEKTQYMQQKKEKELADKEADLNRRELMATAKNTLAEKKLPLELSEVLNYADAESCNKSIVAVEKAFQSAVEAAVNERLKGGKTLTKADNETETLEDQIAKAMSNPW